ncbi:MAG: hypothetical protein RMK20_16365, partial [Verrucomicrobiales bacterium]|nr:hypothetical protein [Verrucomicrobiales bacterium]
MQVNQLTVESNSWLAIAPGFTNLQLTVLGDAWLASGGGVDAVGKGFAWGQGPGRGLFQVYGVNAAGGGGGHAGNGGMGVWTNLSGGGAYYGSVTSPVSVGSGGGGSTNFPGGAGGGAVRLDVRGTLQLDGAILADGQWPPSAGGGGGAGGSVWLSARTLSGSGRISANGGSALLSQSGGGSGGRIAVEFETNLFSGTITAFGGVGYQNGAAGTIYFQTNPLGAAQVLVDNGGWLGTDTHVNSSGEWLIVQGGARAGGLSALRNLLVRADSQYVFFTTGRVNSLTVTGDLRIEPGGAISLDGLGNQPGRSGSATDGRYYSAGTQPTWSGGGGGHGGYGGNGAHGGSSSAGGSPTGSMTQPASVGGAGGSGGFLGGAGGGALQLTVNGLLQLDGRISARGLPGRLGGVGGGAGGSLWLTLSRWAGSGQLLADGGSGDLPNGGGGSGGRIAVICSGSNAFAGTISARGGPGATAGAAGTIYLQLVGQPRQLIVDNGG